MKKLRTLYNQDPAAKKFLEDHPEFDDRFLEQTEVNHPGFDTAKGRYTLNDVAEDVKEYADTMQEAIKLLPLKSPARKLLEMYYDNNKTVPQLMAAFKIPHRGILDSRIKRAKRTALEAIKKMRRVKTSDPMKPLDVKVFCAGDTVKVVRKLFDDRAKVPVWVDDNGDAYPASIQDILENEPGFSEWEEIWLTD